MGILSIVFPEHKLCPNVALKQKYSYNETKSTDSHSAKTVHVNPVCVIRQ